MVFGVFGILMVIMFILVWVFGLFDDLYIFIVGFYGMLYCVCFNLFFCIWNG